MKPLNANRQRFVAELFATAPVNQTAAYMRVYDVSERVASVEASRLMKDPRIIAEVERWQKQLRDKLELSVADIVKELTLVATADSRELSEYRIGCCRYCHGDGFKYQRTPAEFDRDLAAHIRNRQAEKRPDDMGLEFDIQGGVGFNGKRPPNEDCPECFGDGIGYEVFKDTRNLSPAAARLFQGVKRTRDGLEIKQRSADDAIKLAGQHLGMFKTGIELSAPGGGPVGIAHYSDDDLAAIIAAEQAKKAAAPT